MPADLDRRSVLALGFAGIAGAAMTACGSSSSAEERSAASRGSGRKRILLAYFSRPGENYWNGGRRDLRIGNTEVLARMIEQRLNCDVHRIRAAEPYSDDYDETVERNVREQKNDARPGIVDPPTSIGRYDTVLLASPLWNVRPPMLMRTFTERYDFAGKTVLPVVTYAVSGLGDAAEEYADACKGATIDPGLAVRGERVRESENDLDAWLDQTRLS